RPDPASLLVSGAGVLAFGVAVARNPRARALAALALCAHAGALELALRLRDADAALSLPAERNVEASVAEVRESGRGIRLVLDELAAADADPAPLPARVLLLGEPGDSSLRALPPGARLRARLLLRMPFPLRNPGRPPDDALTRAGIAALATLREPELLVRVPERDRGGLAAWLHGPRRRAADRLLALGPGGALLAALSLGDRSGLPSDAQDAFARLGIAHLLSVSGLHLALAAAFAYALCAGVLRRSTRLAARCDTRDAARAAAVAAAFVYAVLTGFEVPVRRSFALVAAGALSLAASRTSRAWHPLAAAALWVLAFEPQALFEAGPQLSFAACAALVAAARHDAPPVAGRRARVASLLRTTAAASLATTPIAAWHGLPAAPLALVSNAVAVPWTGVALMPASLGGALLGALPGGRWSELALRGAVAIGDWSLAAVSWAARGALAGAGTAPSHPLCALAAGVALALCRARDTRVLCAAALGTALLLAFAPPPALAPETPRLVVLDVGSGDALLVQGRDGAVLVDAGPALPGRFDRGRDTVVPALRALGVRRLDLVIATHADLDHRGGLPAVLSSLPVGALWLSQGSADDPGFAEAIAAAREAGVPVREISAADPPQRLGDLRITPVWPAPGAGGPRNERSLGVHVETARRSVLLLGDLGVAEPALLAREGPPLRADVLVLPHHGSRRSSSAALLAAVSPEVAIVSAPCRGRLPHPSSLARARAAGASLWWTGRDGAVLVALGERFAVLPWADRRPQCEPARARSQPAAPTDSVPWKASTSGRQTKRTGGISMLPTPIDADTG
ncbi:MAG TPA: DNA internalization-related competence protein ComEC/Rec2, partial [Myxococcota bacterium]|nr:DNA internalization-related competence protein ComEC/Rec2 [Myxococcota bacterium]